MREAQTRNLDSGFDASRRTGMTVVDKVRGRSAIRFGVDFPPPWALIS
jgi:hypothetical protein